LIPSPGLSKRVGFFHFWCRWLSSMPELHHPFAFLLSSILFFYRCASVLGAGKKHIEFFPWYMDSERCSTTSI
jgi:thiosulfate reductase cytochrome b subunit